jgi:putative Holliday junction resolvase
MNNHPSGSGRILGLDPGERRVGVAVSDPSGILATGITALDARNWKVLITSILEISDRENIKIVVIGNPLTLKGTRGPLAPFVDRLAKALIEHNLEVILWDERFSSSAARKQLIQQGVKTGHHKDDVNRKAAEWILQSYLDARN